MPDSGSVHKYTLVAGGGANQGVFFRFQKGGSNKNKAGMRGIRNFKREMRVILGAKIQKNSRGQFCVTIIVIF